VLVRILRRRWMAAEEQERFHGTARSGCVLD
jgi:hypothetical protein